MEQFHLNWHTFSDHVKEMMQNLLLSNESTDITLICEDKTKFKAHKFVLNACSPLFQTIINDLPQKDPVIYLKGVLAQEMKSILQFMYIGKATFYQNRMNQFLNVARSLEIKEISKNVDQEIPHSPNNQEFDENVEPYIRNSHEETTNVRAGNNVEGEMEHKGSNVINHRIEASHFPCDRCDKHYAVKSHLIRHIKSAHEGVKYPCNDCGYEAKHMHHLKDHIKVVHEGVMFTCDLCDLKFTQQQSLNYHKNNKH